jgi:hypothetical protein
MELTMPAQVDAQFQFKRLENTGGRGFSIVYSDSAEAEIQLTYMC